MTNRQIKNEKPGTTIAQLKRELSKYKRHNATLQESERRLRSLLNNMPGFVFRCKNDRNYTMEYVSDGCLEITGYKPFDFIGNKKICWPDLYINGEYKLESRMIVKKELAEKGSYQYVYQIKKASGEIKWIYDQGVGIYSKNGKLIAIEGLITDLTDQKQAELRLHRENIILRSSVKERYRFGNIIGKSLPMQKIYDLILKSAAVDANVVILGETGTGKELVARAIHDASDRAKNNFVAVNCMAMPEGLIESEFFGHRKGAFTGAYDSKHGFLHEANQGTLFLDEVGGIGLEMQSKLLRAIDNGIYTPIGEKIPQQSDFRIISASNKNLAELVKNGLMREDFFYRISVIPINLPPLRERKEDIPLIVEYLLRRNKMQKGSKYISGSQMDILQSYHWPGNVRELKNVIQRIYAEGNIDFLKKANQNLANEAVDLSAEEVSSDFININETLENIEKDIILKTLEKVKWNKTKTAKALGITRKALYRRMKRLGL